MFCRVNPFIHYRENPKIGNYPSSACPYVKQYTLAGVGQFPIFGYSLYCDHGVAKVNACAIYKYGI